jgi:predicted nuclease of predicted toxin-antitoxin system
VIWLTCGNTTNARLREILAQALPQAIKLLEAGEAIVEINGA